MSETNKKKMPWNIIAILTVSIVPILAAYISFYTGIGVSEDTVNEGILIKSDPPKTIQDILTNADGDIPSYDRNYTWRLIIPMTDHCNEQCQHNLYTTRQVHIRLGEKAERVERYVVNLGGEKGKAYLAGIAKEYPQIKSFNLSESLWDKWVAGANLPADINEQPYYVIIDQVGFAMMYYTAEHDGNQLLKDVKRILRYSVEK